MTTRVGINGFGRIGRAFVRRAAELPGIEIAAVNDITDARTLAYLLEFDSIYGRFGRPVDYMFGRPVDYTSDTLVVDGHKIAVLAGRDPGEIGWGSYGADVVIESTGRFCARDQAARHLAGGAKKVLICAPCGDADLTVVLGVNQAAYDPARHEVISAASPTTCCVAPMAKVLDDAFGILGASITSVHACTGDQMPPDDPRADLRRARPAAGSIIPAATGAARTTSEVIPGLAGLVDGIAVRVPVEDGSLASLAAQLATRVPAGEINDAFRRAALGPMADILRYSTDPIVSRDIIGDPASCVFDAGLTLAGGTLATVFGWYDNEWGYACRLADLAILTGSRLSARRCG